MHRHINKTEDIINSGGGRLALELFHRGPDGAIDAAAQVQVRIDGHRRENARRIKAFGSPRPSA